MTRRRPAAVRAARDAARGAATALLRARVPDPRLSRWDPEPALRVPATEVARAAWPAVDVHNHLGRWLTPGRGWMVPDVPGLVGLLDELNVRAVVNLDGRWGAELEANLDRYDQAYPGRFVTYCHLDWSLLRRRDADDALVAALRRARSAGARGVKVWKDLGLRVRDRWGRLVLPDDPRLAPAFAAAGELGMPVLVHTGDPVAFFRPADRRNERLEELRRFPTAGLAPRRGPGLDRLLAALEAVVAAHPGTTFVAAHVGCLAEDLAAVGRLLDRYPNLTVDLAARAAELGRQPRVARAFVTRFADRVLFGTDAFPPSAAAYRTYFRLLETDDDHFPYSAASPPPHGRWPVYGLDLPPDVLRRVYGANAARLLPGIALPSPGSGAGTRRTSR